MTIPLDAWKNHLVREGPDDTGEGDHKLYRFPSGYGLSILRNQESAGGTAGLWEAMVVLIDQRGNVRRATDTRWPGGVVGCLDDHSVDALLEEVSQLPRHDIAIGLTEADVTELAQIAERIEQADKLLPEKS